MTATRTSPVAATIRPIKTVVLNPLENKCAFTTSKAQSIIKQGSIMASPASSTSSTATSKPIALTKEAFEEHVHTDIDKPITNYRLVRTPGNKHNRKRKVHNGAHRASWSEASIDLKSRTISIEVYLNFKQNSLSDADYQKLKNLACAGIKRYWSRIINVDGQPFTTAVTAKHRNNNAIPVDLAIETDAKKYARSMNPAILTIDASFIYNAGIMSNTEVDDDFKLVSAHEFGHSVLMYSDGLFSSWGHNGSTNPILQSVKSSTPGYPSTGDIDLMKYYDWTKGRAAFSRRILDTIAMEIDIKRLIWGAELTWI